MYENCTDINDCLDELNENPKLAVIASRAHVTFDRTINRNKFYCFPITESFFNYHYSLHSRYGYQFLPKIDLIITRLVEGGISNNWATLQVYENNLINKNASKYTEVKFSEEWRLDSNLKHENELISLKLEHIYGALLILVVGNSLATITFIVEVAFERWSRRSKQ